MEGFPWSDVVLTGIIAGIVCPVIVLIFCVVAGVEKRHVIRNWMVSAFLLGVILGGWLGYADGKCNQQAFRDENAPKAWQMVWKANLKAMSIADATSSRIEGSFFLGCGNIKGEGGTDDYYSYWVEKELGAYQKSRMLAEKNIYVIEDQKPGVGFIECLEYRHIEKSKRLTDNLYGTKYKFHIPKGSILNQYKMN